jgi:hypothetical protein
MATSSLGWTTYALLAPTKGGKEWKVQINEAGQFRCNCPAYIFSGKGGAVRTCKHCRRCEAQQQLEQPTVVAQAPAIAPALAEAIKVFDAMCLAGTQAARVNVKTQLGSAAQAAMVKSLAEKLASWVPTVAPVVAAASVVNVGIRRITFDD